MSILHRFLEIFISIVILILLSVPILFIIICIKLNIKGSIFFISQRIGKKNQLFKMIKFRTMNINAPIIATHLFKESEKYINLTGKFLRKTSLDEIPQLFHIISGTMTFVGPRPALYNQYDLIDLRKKKGIDMIKPGITGWAQINGRDNISIKEKVELDLYYLQNKSIFLDVKIVFLTFIRVIMKNDITN